MNSLLYILDRFFYKPLLQLYLKTDSTTKFDGFNLKILKGVFHPKLFYSTPYFYSFLEKHELNQKRFLEVGSGSGVLSLLAHKKGAVVTAVDLDQKAVENTRINFARNFADTENVPIIQSDLFTNLPSQKFDVIVINPPYFFKNVEDDKQLAWYCGENGEYFHKLFSQLAGYTSSESNIFAVLSESCDLDRIMQIAKQHNWQFKPVEQKRLKWEMNYIYRIEPFKAG